MKKEQQYFFDLTGKKFVADARGSDFAHPGEEEAVELVVKNFPMKKVYSLLKENREFENDNVFILDVGCGTGATVEHLHQTFPIHFKRICHSEDEKLGEKVSPTFQVFGCDIDSESIKVAQKRYSSPFFECDVNSLPKYMKKERRRKNNNNIVPQLPPFFHIITMFSVFYEIPNQKKCLKSLFKITQKGSILVLFDYSVIPESSSSSFSSSSSSSSFSSFLHPERTEKLLNECGWKQLQYLDISNEFEQWYDDFTKKISSKKEELSEKYSWGLFYAYRQSFNQMLKQIQLKIRGGALVFAERK